MKNQAYVINAKKGSGKYKFLTGIRKIFWDTGVGLQALMDKLRGTWKFLLTNRVVPICVCRRRHGACFGILGCRHGFFRGGAPFDLRTRSHNPINPKETRELIGEPRKPRSSDIFGHFQNPTVANPILHSSAAVMVIFTPAACHTVNYIKIAFRH